MENLVELAKQKGIWRQIKITQGSKSKVTLGKNTTIVYSQKSTEQERLSMLAKALAYETFGYYEGFPYTTMYKMLTGRF